MSKCAVFHDAQAELAEGLFVDNLGKQVLWVDIHKGCIYRKSFDGQSYREYPMDGEPSALLGLQGSTLLFCDNKGLAELDIETGEVAPLSENPETAHNDVFRSNDGVALPGGCAIYGTMERSPGGLSGGLYYFDGKNTKTLNIPIGIPNGFIRLDESDILIADSYTKRVNLFKVSHNTAMLRFERCWHDFAMKAFTPDGGCTDEAGHVYIALWDGCGIAVLNCAGELIRVLEMPVLRPTNCKLAHSGKLYVTSARNGMTVEQLEMYPQSGSIFEINLI